MRRLLTILIAAGSVVGVLWARPELQTQTPKEEPKLIDLKADLMGPIAPGDSAKFLVGNFAAQHNGAVITCDSAVHYSSDHMEFFGNVLINKNTTYIYGDRAEYDGLRNEARVYSDIVKVIDGEATLYTYEFIFNTQTNIGRFERGGVMYNRDNLMEADHGFYYSDTKELICVKNVQMSNDEYQMKGDSVIYNVETDHAQFFENTNIWNQDDDYLYADRGEYVKADTLYKVTLNGYILTEKQEVWSDSIDYFRPREHAILRRDIQIDDTEHKTLGFGDYGEYWKTPGDALLTRRPSMISYDPGQPDSLYMRADSMFLYTILVRDAEAAEAKAAELLADRAADSLANTAGAGQKGGKPQPPKMPSKPGDAKPGTSVTSEDPDPAMAPDSLAADSLAIDSLARTGIEPADSAAMAQPELTPEELKAKAKEEAKKAKEEAKIAAAKLRDAKLDSIADHRQERTTARLKAEEARETRALEARKAKAEARFKKRQQRAQRKGKALPDSSELRLYDSLLANQSALRDSLAVDSLAIDSLQQDSTAFMPADSVDSLSQADTLFRLVKAYRNVRTYRTDFQSVCDSLVGISRDSTLHLYITPVLWNEENQITSDVMDIFTKNQQIVRAEFVGSPMMVSQLDTLHYNQVAGKKMEAFFHDNKIFRNDVNGNAQTIYYMQEEGDPQVKGVMVIDSGSISFYINDQNKIETITYRNDVTWTAYPMDKIPPELKLFLGGFKWEGPRRPTRRDVFDRVIRPTEREERSRLPRPDFPIAERLERDKIRFGEQGWADRNEVVTPEIDEWMRSLGFPTGQPRPAGSRL